MKKEKESLKNTETEKKDLQKKKKKIPFSLYLELPETHPLYEEGII